MKFLIIVLGIGILWLPIELVLELSGYNRARRNRRRQKNPRFSGVLFMLDKKKPLS